MKDGNLFYKIRKIISEQLSIDEDSIHPDTNIIDDLNADSLDIVEMVLNIEDELDISIDDESIGNIHTVQNILDYIEQNQEE